MSFLATIKASLGDAVLKGSMTPTVSTAFTATQNELWTGVVTAVASQITSIGIRAYTTSHQASMVTGVPTQPGDFIYFNQTWVTTQTDTCVALMAQINANAVLGPLLTGASTGSGNFTIIADVGYIVIEFVNVVHATIAKTLKGFDLTYYQGKVILMGTTTADINYNEIGVAAVAGVGILVVADNPFDIVGAENIANARVIEASGGSPATVNYEIYIG